MKLDPLAEEPTFDMNTELKSVNLPKLNDFFKAYAKIDVNRGIFGLFVEGAGKDGKFVGYFKPLIKDLDIVGPEDRNDNIFKKFWEATTGGVGIIFRNQRHDQVATKVPIEGTFENTKVRILPAIFEVLKNAFIEALRPSVDNEININTVDEGNESTGPLKGLTEKDKDRNENETGIRAKEPEEKKEKKGLFKRMFNKKDKDGKEKNAEKK
jgi:hypothetical protein